MIAAQRLKKIKDTLIEKKIVDIATLTSLLDCSDVTVRSDLEKLEAENFLTRFHGGAVLVDEFEQSKNNQVIDNLQQKNQIAELVSNIVDDDDIVFLGSGSTCYLCAYKLKEKSNLSVITNNINISHELSQIFKKVVCVGGEIKNNKGMKYSIGNLALEYAKNIFVNKCIIGVDSVDLLAGFTLNDEFLSVLIKDIMRISKQVIFVVDHTKYDKIGLYTISDIDSPQIVISDEKVSDKYKEHFYNNNIKLMIAYNTSSLE